MKTIILLLLLLSSTAFAGENADVYVAVNMMTYHVDREATEKYDLNEINPGIGIELSKNDITIAAGTYYNSLRRQSNYLLASYTPHHFGNVNLGLIAGGISGYDPDRIIPAAGFIAVIHAKTLSMNIIVAPEAREVGVYGFVEFQLKFKLN